MIGPGRAAEMPLTGAPITAATALEEAPREPCGPDDRRAAAEEVAIYLQAPPDAIRFQKEADRALA
jgi:enoyl-CoA hydratase/carnithine racemase